MTLRFCTAPNKLGARLGSIQTDQMEIKDWDAAEGTQFTERTEWKLDG